MTKFGKSTSHRVRQEIVSPLSYPNWDQLIEKFTDAEFFHTTRWAKVLSETYAHRPNYIVFRDDAEIRAVLPIMEVNSWLTGRRGVSLPFTDACPLLAKGNEASTELILESALELGRARKWRYLELRMDKRIADKQSSLQFYSHKLDLAIGEKQLLSGCASSVRRAIRKARNERIEIAFLNGVVGAKEYYKLHCLTRKRHGLPPQPWSFFRSLGQSCLSKENGFVSIASLAGQAVAGAVFLIDGDRAHYKFGASDDRFLKLRGNNLVMWESICRLVEMGMKSLCFGRTSLAHEGLRKFKMGWGSHESNVYYYRFRPSDGSVLPMTDRSNGFYNSVFQRLPLPLLRLAGELAYRHQS